MIDRDAYCRELERHLCRKNDGHLIRVVGPAFERVMSWAERGVPLTIAQLGIDRYFERQARKTTRRRPVRIEFCEADILDAFDEWRRAVGVSVVAPDETGGPLVEEPAGVPRARRSLPAHLDSVLARLQAVRAARSSDPLLDSLLAESIARLEALKDGAAHARGPARDAVIEQLASIDGDIMSACLASIDADERALLERQAATELGPFQARMRPDALDAARHAAVAQLVRDRFGLPTLAY